MEAAGASCRAGEASLARVALILGSQCNWIVDCEMCDLRQACAAAQSSRYETGTGRAHKRDRSSFCMRAWSAWYLKMGEQLVQRVNCARHGCGIMGT